LFFRTVPTANTLVRWVNENAFAPIVRARPCPTFGRPVHRRVAPIDYSPVLLLIPFGFHLTMDTLSSGVTQRRLQVHLGCVRLSPSCPFRLLHTSPFPGQRGITPAFGYSAPHPGAGGTLTLLNSALLSAHYDPPRHPSRPSPALTSYRLISTAITAGASRVASGPRCLHAVANTPAGLKKLIVHTPLQLRPSHDS
jgi:hypothetical protein